MKLTAKLQQFTVVFMLINIIMNIFKTTKSIKETKTWVKLDSSLIITLLGAKQSKPNFLVCEWIQCVTYMQCAQTFPGGLLPKQASHARQATRNKSKVWNRMKATTHKVFNPFQHCWTTLQLSVDQVEKSKLRYRSAAHVGQPSTRKPVERANFGSWSLQEETPAKLDNRSSQRYII